MNLRQKFYRKVDKQGPNGCWLWKGSVQDVKKRYGAIWHEGKRLKAHRVSWELANSRKAGELHVLHHCDNPQCVNPEHLYLGTHADNMRDKSRRGRANAPSGEAWHRTHAGRMATGDRQALRKYPHLVKRGSDVPWAKLTESQVREIKRVLKAENGRRGICVELAKKYGVSADAIRRIKRGVNWPHIE